jgi:hypothetical protein
VSRLIVQRRSSRCRRHPRETASHVEDMGVLERRSEQLAGYTVEVIAPDFAALQG